MKTARPPLLASIVLTALLRDTDGHSFHGDLDERFNQLMEVHGIRQANRWYWRQVLSVAVWTVRRSPDRPGKLLRHAVFGEWRNLRYGLRSLARDPLHTLSAVLVLGLGIGTSVAVFSVSEAVVLRDFPVEAPSHIVRLWTYQDPAVELALYGPRPGDLEPGLTSLSGLAAYNHRSPFQIPIFEGDRPLRISGASVTADFFEVLGVQAEQGRMLEEEDGGATVLPSVISHRTWVREFGAEAVAGRRLTTPHDQTTYEIVGVAPAGFDFPPGTDYWISLPNDIAPGVGLNVVGRLAPGASAETARDQFLAVVRELDPRPVGRRGSGAETLADAVFGDTRLVLSAISIAGGILLLIACVNVSGLLLLRLGKRAPDLRLRRALGARPTHIVRMLSGEVLLVSLGGGVVGLACSTSLIHVVATYAPTGLPRSDLIAFNTLIFLCASLVAGLCVLGFGLLPGLMLGQPGGPFGRAVGSSSPTPPRPAQRARQVLVVCQLALAVTLVAGAGLLGRTLHRLTSLDLGYQGLGLSILQVSIPFGEFDEDGALHTALGQLYSQIREVPGVEALTPILLPPFEGASSWLARPSLPGQPDTEGNAWIPVEAGGQEYFETMGIPILRGRGFFERDDGGAPRVAVLSESLADQLWPDGDGMGRQFELGGPVTVVGIAGDVRYRRLRESDPTLYLPWRQSSTQGYFAIRTQIGLSAILPVVRSSIRDFDSRMSLWDARPLGMHLGGTLQQPRVNAVIFSAFALVALALAAIGLFATISATVRDSAGALGIRMALGATPGRVWREVIGSSAKLVLSGIGLGVAIVFAASRLMSALLYQVSPLDPWTLMCTATILLLVAWAAAVRPARQATSVDPMVVLGSD